MTPIAKAVAPLKRAVVMRAMREAINDLHRVKRNLAAHGWNIKKAIPHDWRTMSERDYKNATRKLNAYMSIVSPINSYKFEDRDIVEMSPAKMRHHIEAAADNAATLYDMFVRKLNHKVGAHTKAKLEGNHVWGYSILTVTMPDKSVQRWKTQCIDNRSKLGLWFLQYPSRKIK